MITIKKSSIKRFAIVAIVLISLISTYAITSIAWKNTYSENHNCVQMSEEVHNTLELFGIPSNFVFGHTDYPNGTIKDCHCWLQIAGLDFDAVNLQFCDNSKQYHVDGIFEKVGDKYFIIK